MPHCIAEGCRNSSNFNNLVSYHRLPSDASRESWLIAINRNNLPKHIHLCSNHFSEEYFDKGHDLKQKLLEEKKKTRKLLPNAVPTIFKNRTEEEVHVFR